MRRTVCLLLSAAVFVAVHARTFEPAPNWEYRRYNGSYQYHLYIPDGVEPGHSYPLAMGLHGCCWDGDTANTIGDPISNGWHDFTYNMQREPTYIVAPAENDYSPSTLIPLLRSLFEEFPIDTQRVMVAGFSMGSGGVAGLLNSYPTFFSAALYIAGGSGYNSGFATAPVFMCVGDQDGMRSDMIPVATQARAANGDNRGPLQWVTGVNPYFEIYAHTGHGPAMCGAFGQPWVLDWAYSRVADGNRYPNIRFTQTSPAWKEILPAATTSITVTAEAGDVGGEITSVVFALDGVEHTTDTEAPYAATIDGLTPGDHIITATATDNGTAQGKALDKTRTATIEFGVLQNTAIATTSMPAGAVGVFYQDTLRVSAGNGPYTWYMAGGALPTDLNLTPRGRIEGIPGAEGSFDFTVMVMDTTGSTATQALSITVGPVPAGVVHVSNISKMSARGKYIPWLFDEGEPFGATGGYGDPQGWYSLAAHPVFDGWHDVADLAGATQIRMSTLAGDITAADVADSVIDFLSFDVNSAADVHVGYPRSSQNGIPPWLTAAGFTATGEVFRRFGQDLYDYVKTYQPGRVILGPTDGENTGASQPYCVVVAPEGGIGVGAVPVRRTHTAVNLRPVGKAMVAVSISDQPTIVRVLNCMGRVVMSREVTVSTTLDLGGLAAGSYQVRAGGVSVPMVVVGR